jgi:hypothetical protein
VLGVCFFFSKAESEISKSKQTLYAGRCRQGGSAALILGARTTEALSRGKPKVLLNRVFPQEKQL